MKKLSHTLTEDQIKRANSLEWYHAIDFGSHQTAGRINPPLQPNMTLFGVMDLLCGIEVKGKSCLEVGPAHGLISSGLYVLGAEKVSCIDIGSAKPPQMSLSEEVFDCEFEFYPNSPLEKVQSIFSPASFDLIVCAGVMYHLLNPADVFFKLRRLLKPGGLLVMETVCVENEEKPILLLNSEDGGFPQPTTYFLASRSALEGLARLACFDVLATRLNSPSRFSLLGCAVSSEEVADRTRLCKEMHDFGFEDPSFDTILEEDMSGDHSEIRFEGELGHKKIDVKKYIPEFPTHPQSMENVLGKNFHVPGLTK